MENYRENKVKHRAVFPAPDLRAIQWYRLLLAKFRRQLHKHRPFFSQKQGPLTGYQIILI